MQVQRWEKIEKIFEATVVLPFIERESFLKNECGEDFELREEIDLMLVEDLDEEFLSDPVLDIGMRLLDEGELLREPEFGHYQLLRLLGRGGMGEVYLAQDRRLERLVALKILPAAIIEDQDAVRRFQQEARAASGVSHPNVAHIYEFGEANNRWFLAMEYIEGKTLRELLSERKLDEYAIVDILLQITEALVATHRRSIIHRDIKPENIIFAEDGKIKVLDFGLAKQNISALAENSQKTILIDLSPEIIFGTVAYMSPEQLSGQVGDQRTDLWSLGVVMFEMLTGKRPFRSETTDDIREAILNDNPDFENIPKNFRPVVVKLLQKDPAARYQSAADLLADLQSLENPQNHSLFYVLKDRKYLACIIFVVFFVLMSAVGLRIFSDSPVQSAAMPFNSIAVLPFVNETADEEKEYLSDGLSETLINKLSRLSKLSVTPKSTVFRYKGKATDSQTVGQELGVQTVLSGHLTGQNDDLVLTLNLTDVKTGNQIWSKRYIEKNSDLIKLQDEIGRDVSANLQTHLSRANELILGKSYTQNPEAYNLYLKGRFYWSKRTAKDLQKSLDYYNQSIALDPNFALAYVGLADTYLIASGYAILTPHESFPKAKESAQKALEIDDTLAEAHNALSYELFNYEWNAAEAEKEIKLAIELNPNYATTHHWYSNAILTATGRFDEAIAEGKRAEQLDPLSLVISADLGAVYIFARRNDEAVEQFQKTLEMDDGFAYAYAQMGRAYLAKNDFPKAVAACQKAQSLYDDPRPTVVLARTYAKQGNRQKSLELLNQLKNIAKQRYVSAYYFALIYVGLGENDKAFEQLEKAFEDREGRMTLLKVDPLMDELRADPRFDAMVNRIWQSNDSN